MIVFDVLMQKCGQKMNMFVAVVEFILINASLL